MEERIIELVTKLTAAAEQENGDYGDFFRDRAAMLKGWLQGYRRGEQGHLEYRAQVLKDLEGLLN